MTDTMPPASPAPAVLPQSGFLHVVFHGLFCFFEEPSHIRVRAPRIPTMPGMSGMPAMKGHSYLIGPYLGERALDPGTGYVLRGVQPGSARFDPARNLVLKGSKPSENPAELHAEMVFPYPDLISSIQGVPIDPQALFAGGSLPLVLNTTRISTLQVFTYRFADAAQLMVEGVGPGVWNPASQMAGGFASLHVIAEPDESILPGHFLGAFPIAMKMFHNVDLAFLSTPKVPPVTFAEVPFGARLEEMSDYSIRIDQLASLGALIRRGGNLSDFLRPSGVLHSGDIERCAGVVGG